MSDALQVCRDSVCEELEARANGFDVHGRPIARPGVPSKADLQQLEAEKQSLSRPLGDEELDAVVLRADGSKAIQHVSLSSIIDTYKKLCAQKEAELGRLEHELQAVDADLADGYAALEDDNDADLVLAKERFDADMAQYKREVQASKEKSDAEFERANAEDKAATADFNRKVQNLVKGLLE